MDAAISKTYADLNISELKPQDNADSSSVEGVNSRYLTPKTADSVTYGANDDILSSPVLGPIADWVGNNGKDDGSKGFSKLGMGIGGVLGGLEDGTDLLADRVTGLAENGVKVRKLLLDH